MADIRDRIDELHQGLLTAARGSGPLLQRDYWAVIRNCRLRPSEVMELVRRRFQEFPPQELVRFWRADGAEAPLEVGDELRVHIRMSGETGVRVLHRDANSITLGTLEGHPEAGKITFGAYRNPEGDVIFHIRSRARSGSDVQYLGFLMAGEAMQTNTWTDCIDRLAHTVGEGVIGAIHAETDEVRNEEDDPREVSTPTFIAKGD